MSAEPPPPPEISSDGKFYWDGQRWLPMAGTAPVAPAPVARVTRGRSYPGRTLVIGCLGLIVLVVAGVLVVGVCGSNNTIHGTLTVQESVGQGSCTGTGGYDDIHAGTQVTIRDQSGKLLATGLLDGGTPQGLEACVFTFTIDHLPSSDFYQVEVSHRGEISYSRSDLEHADWHVDLTLGG